MKTPHRPPVLVDQVGYDPSAPKHALVQGSGTDHFTAFKVVDAQTGKVVLRGTPKPAGKVDHWHDWQYWTIDFSALKTPGSYRVDVSGNVDVFSFPFHVANDVLQRYTLSNVIYYFKGQRVSGAMGRADAHLKNPDPAGPAYVDLHGGWYAATDDGMPVAALAEYASIATPARKQKVREAIRRSMEFQLRITGDVNNPFGYARELVKLANGTNAVKFFFPHGADGTWWQGEDARLASLAAAARVAAPMFANDPAFQARLQHYAWDQLHWILGRNPYDTSMLIGSGHRNIQYMFFDSWEYTSAPSAIINGITAGLDGEDDGIAFDLGYAETGKDDDWRWGEQWLPHAVWYMVAISLPHD